MDPNLPSPLDSLNPFEISDTFIFSDPNHYQNIGFDRDLDQIYQNLATDPVFDEYDDPSFQFHQPHVLDPVDFAPQVPDFPSEIPFPSHEVEDSDFSETMKYMSQVLMEENLEQKPSMFYDPLTLKLTEKSFLDALRENQDQDGFFSSDFTSTSSSSNNSTEFKPSSPETPVSEPNGGDDHHQHFAFQFTAQPISQKPKSSNKNGILDLDSSISKLLSQNIFTDADSVSQFHRGLEEARKFLPKGAQLMNPVEINPIVSVNKRREKRINHEREGSDEEEEGRRCNKQSAVYVDESTDELSAMFDKVLLSVENVPLCASHQEKFASHQPPSEAESCDHIGGNKARSKKQDKRKETVDLRTLLVLCAQSVSANDSRTAHELLKQIRKHASPLGDASQRVAHYFANGLEARLIGAANGTQIFYSSLGSKRISAFEILKAYQVSMDTSPFKKFAHFFALKNIMAAAEKSDTLHIIDFGILYGFQWPILIKFLSERDGGPPKLKITGIEFPQPGFRPAERIEETGRRLANYSKRFNVPFEYKAIASQDWETIKIEDLNIERNEVLAVNTLMRFKTLMDETTEARSPRDEMLRLIRKMKPDIFVHSILNGSYNAPFFVTRFREALFHFSALYDMFDTMIPRENESRLMFEKEIYGRDAMNVVACEGFERVERPETYKQWQTRVTRAGFKQLPLNKELMTKFRNKMKKWYHRDFVFDEDNNWMLQGWKGRILYASTCWIPA